MSAEPGFPWHRAFHPLCGADPVTLLRLAARRGAPSAAGAPTFAVACAMSLLRLPFTLAEQALDLAVPDPEPPLFVVGHPRSGTTHLHNALAASGAFATVPPTLAALPWERRSIGPLMRPFVDSRLPRTRLIDGVALRGDGPTEDEVGLANAGDLSYFHAIYFPRRFRTDYREGLLHEGSPRRRASRERAIRRYVRAMSRLGAAPLLLKNPAYTARVDLLARLFPGARFIHIRRDPAEVFASTRRMLGTVLAELSLQNYDEGEVEEAILEVYPQVMAGLRRSSAELPEGTFAEVEFRSVVEAPRPTLTRLWRELKLPGGDEALEAACAYCASLSGFRPAANVLSRGEMERLRRRWPAEMGAQVSAAGTG